MRRSVIVLMILIIICSFAFGEYYEKVKSYQVGPGTIYSYYEEKSKPWAIHVTEIDLKNPYITLETKKADDLLLGREGTSSMSSRSDAPGHRVVSAVNGDFYNTANGQPLNNQIVNGEFVQGYTYSRSAFAYSEGGIPDIVKPNFSGVVISKDTNDVDVSHSLNVVNNTRYTNYIVLYNNYMGASTGTNTWGFECLLNPITEWVVNDTVYAVIEARETGSDPATGNMTIPQGKFVLSGHGSGTTFLNENCQIGDTVKVVQQMAYTPKRLMQLVGGGPWMMQNGVDITAQNTDGFGADFYAVRHPRTAVGFSADSTIAYFMVVDGRNDHSIGMTCHEQAAFLKSLGAAHALNLDGGGSSTFTVRSEVMNVPSDNWERIVANALMCVSSAPDSDLAIVQIERDSIAVYKNNTFDVPMSGWDMYYNPKTIPEGSGLQVNHTPDLGVYNNYQFTASDLDMDGYIYTDLNSVCDTMKVHIISIDSLMGYPQLIVTDTLRPVDLSVYGSRDGKNVEKLDNEIFEFELLNANIGSVNEQGIFTPTSSGESELLIHYGQTIDTLNVYVERGVGELSLQEVEDATKWTLIGENLDSNLTTIQWIDRTTSGGSKAIKVDYTTTDNGIISLDLSEEIQVYGVPSEFLIDARSDGLRHRLYLVFDDTNGNEYRFKASGYFSDADMVTWAIPIANIIPGDGYEDFPMYLKSIYIDLENGVQSGTLYFDRIRCTYPGWTSIDESGDGTIPSEFALMQNYPNPFNPITAISYQLSAHSDVHLSIYDVKGRKIATLVNRSQESGVYSVSFDASMLPGGVYFYRLQTDNWSDTKKMLLIK